MEERKSKSTAAKSTKRGRPKSASRGVGDTIEKVTTATGIKAAVDWFAEATGVDCGCDARKEKLNKLFPYKKPECLTKEEYDFIASTERMRIVGTAEQRQINTIYNRVFHANVQPTNCGSCLAGRIDELLSVKSAYDEQG